LSFYFAEVKAIFVLAEYYRSLALVLHYNTSC